MMYNLKVERLCSRLKYDLVVRIYGSTNYALYICCIVRVGLSVFLEVPMIRNITFMRLHAIS